MRFAPIRYLQWAKRWLDQSPPRWNLASSGMAGASATDLGLADRALGDFALAGDNTLGHEAVTASLAAWYSTTPDRVLCASGTSLANFLVQAALLEPGDEALCEWPAYEPLFRTLQSHGARVGWVQRAAANGYQPDLAAIREGFCRGAKLLVLSDLHNPTARLLDRGVRREIAALAERYGAWVLVDEVYLSGVFDREVTSAASESERMVITASLTKTFGLGGLRAGWAIAPPWVCERAREVNDHLGVEGPYVADEIAAQALARLPALTDRARRRRAEGLPRVREFAAARGLRWTEPDGGFIAWVGLPDGTDAVALVEHLRTTYDALATPGDFFGVPSALRIGFGQPPAVVEEGLARLGRALDDLGAR